MEADEGHLAPTPAGLVRSNQVYRYLPRVTRQDGINTRHFQFSPARAEWMDQDWCILIRPPNVVLAFCFYAIAILSELNGDNMLSTDHFCTDLCMLMVSFLFFFFTTKAVESSVLPKIVLLWLLLCCYVDSRVKEILQFYFTCLTECMFLPTLTASGKRTFSAFPSRRHWNLYTWFLTAIGQYSRVDQENNYNSIKSHVQKAQYSQSCTGEPKLLFWRLITYRETPRGMEYQESPVLHKPLILSRQLPDIPSHSKDAYNYMHDWSYKRTPDRS